MKAQRKQTFIDLCPDAKMRNFAVWYIVHGSGAITPEALAQVLGQYAIQQDLCRGVVTAWAPKIREWTTAYHAANRGG